jgi:hypothetical protein
VLEGRAPSAGRYCGACYHPLAADRTECPHCGTLTADVPPADALPSALIEAHRARRGREGTAVRTVAWAGLTLGVVLALLPLAFWGVTWWSVSLFFGIMFGFYLLSANLANTVGDAIGYRMGQAAFRKKWPGAGGQR